MTSPRIQGRAQSFTADAPAQKGQQRNKRPHPHKPRMGHPKIQRQGKLSAYAMRLFRRDRSACDSRWALEGQRRAARGAAGTACCAPTQRRQKRDVRCGGSSTHLKGGRYVGNCEGEGDGTQAGVPVLQLQRQRRRLRAGETPALHLDLNRPC
jgi:hypothetical protein